jgi:hypothetical protein
LHQHPCLDIHIQELVVGLVTDHLASLTLPD